MSEQKQCIVTLQFTPLGECKEFVCDWDAQVGDFLVAKAVVSEAPGVVIDVKDKPANSFLSFFKVKKKIIRVATDVEIADVKALFGSNLKLYVKKK